MDNEQLLKILNKSKQIMKADVSPSSKGGGAKRYSTGGRDIDINYYDEDYDDSVNEQYVQNAGLLEEQLPSMKGDGSGALKLPKEIFESMTNMRIPTMEEVLDDHNPFEQAARKMRQQNSQAGQINEGVKKSNNNNDYILVSKSDLKNMMLETLLEIVPKITSNIEEQAIRKTIQTVIKENKQKKERL